MTTQATGAAARSGTDDPRFGDLLKIHRRRAGLTQQALAELATVSSRTIRDLECDRTQARTRTVQLLADGLGLTGLAREVFAEAARRGAVASGPPAELDTEPPHCVNPVLGREQEIHAMIHALEIRRRRAIMVLGLGGVGKSRTVLEVARRLHRQRKWPVIWVSANQRPRPAHGCLIDEVGRLLTSSTPDGSRLCRLIGEHDALMVLDGLTTVTPAVNDLLQDVLGRCPGLRLIITNRGTVLLPGCQPAVISPLPVPPETYSISALTDITSVPSVQLLVERLADTDPGWTPTVADLHAVATLCRRLDGLPLALEIAAYQHAVLSLQEIISLPPAELLRVSAPATATGVSVSIWEVVGPSCRSLDEAQLSCLRALALRTRPWSIEEIVAELRRPRTEILSVMVVLTRLGLVRRRNTNQTSSFEVLNLVREGLRWRADQPGPEPARR